MHPNSSSLGILYPLATKPCCPYCYVVSTEALLVIFKDIIMELVTVDHR